MYADTQYYVAEPIVCYICELSSIERLIVVFKFFLFMNVIQVSRLLSGEMSVEELLQMSSDELANPKELQQREKQRVSSLKASEVSCGVEAALEARRKVAMTGSEAWRDNKSLMESTIQTSSDGNNAATHAQPESLVVAESANSGAGDKKSDQRAAAATAGKKTVDVDAGSRLLSPRSAEEMTALRESKEEQQAAELLQASGKRKRADGDASEVNTSAADSTVAPAKRGPSVLEMLQSTSSTEVESPRSATKLAEESTSESTLASDTLLSLPVKLLSITGTQEFTIEKPGNQVMECYGVVTDRSPFILFLLVFFCSYIIRMTMHRRVQGLIPENLLIRGRSKFPEVEKFIAEKSSQGRKVISSFKMMVTSDVGPNSAFHRFCDEFVTNKRVGVFNNELITVFIFPPALKSTFAILNSVSSKDEQRTLYAVVISREMGPPQFVYAKPEIVHDLSPLPPMPNPVASVDDLPASMRAPEHADTDSDSETYQLSMRQTALSIATTDVPVSEALRRLRYDALAYTMPFIFEDHKDFTTFEQLVSFYQQQARAEEAAAASATSGVYGQGVYLK